MLVLCLKKVSEYENAYCFFDRKTERVYEWRLAKKKQGKEALIMTFGGITVTFLEGIFQKIPVEYDRNNYLIFVYCLLAGALVVTGMVKKHHSKRAFLVRDSSYGKEYDLAAILKLYQRGGARRKFFLFMTIGFSICCLVFLMITRNNRTIGPFIGAYGLGLAAYAVLIWDNPLARYRCMRNIRRQIKKQAMNG